jgi:23S rRNA (cytosine1962-C5)-methyltransferase
VHDAGQAVDHPVPAHFPEARYLKFSVGRVLPRP